MRRVPQWRWSRSLFPSPRVPSIHPSVHELFLCSTRVFPRIGSTSGQGARSSPQSPFLRRPQRPKERRFLCRIFPKKTVPFPMSRARAQGLLFFPQVLFGGLSRFLRFRQSLRFQRFPFQCVPIARSRVLRLRALSNALRRGRDRSRIPRRPSHSRFFQEVIVFPKRQSQSAKRRIVPSKNRIFSLNSSMEIFYHGKRLGTRDFVRGKRYYGEKRDFRFSYPSFVAIARKILSETSRSRNFGFRASSMNSSSVR